MKIRRTANADICFGEADAMQLWCNGITEFKVDTRNRKFILTPVLRGGSEGPSVDLTEMRDAHAREQWLNRRRRQFCGPARVAELKAAAALVKPRPRVALPRDGKQRTSMLLAMIAAERRRSVALIGQLEQ